MKDLYESLHEAHELDEETTTLEADFQRMKKWIEETNPTGIDLAYDGPFVDYVNEVYGTANEKVSEEYDEELYIEPSIQAGRGGVFMYGWGSEISWDFEEECDELLEFAKEATTHEEFLNSVVGYISEKASTLADTAPYENEDDNDEYDDDFDESLHEEQELDEVSSDFIKIGNKIYPKDMSTYNADATEQEIADKAKQQGEASATRKFNNGDRVYVTVANRQGNVTKIISDDVVEVEFQANGIYPERLDRFYVNEVELIDMTPDIDDEF